MLGNTKFHPSFIENEIYNMMDDYIEGFDLYNEGLVSAVTDLLTNYKPGVEWSLGCSNNTCFVSWIEDGYLHMVGFDYKKKEGSL